MGHGITSTDRVITIGESAWHGLDENYPADTVMSGAEAMRTVADWHTLQSEGVTARFSLADGTIHSVDSADRKMLVRSDNFDVLGIPTDGYAPFDPAKCGALMDALANEGGLRVSSAGTIGGGKQLFISALSSSVEVTEGDAMDIYLNLSNSFDGTLSLAVFSSGVRQVCANTVNLALTLAQGGGFKFKHTSGLEISVEEVRRTMANFRRSETVIVEKARKLAAVELTAAQIQEFWGKVYCRLEGLKSLPAITKDSKPGDFRAVDKALAATSHMAQVFDAERQKLRARPSLWIAANAVTNWTQHRRGSIAGTERTASNLFGKGKDMTEDVFAMAEEYGAPLA